MNVRREYGDEEERGKRKGMRTTHYTEFLRAEAEGANAHIYVTARPRILTIKRFVFILLQSFEKNRRILPDPDPTPC
jgi:hypothetical protein